MKSRRTWAHRLRRRKRGYASHRESLEIERSYVRRLQPATDRQREDIESRCKRLFHYRPALAERLREEAQRVSLCFRDAVTLLDSLDRALDKLRDEREHDGRK